MAFAQIIITGVLMTKHRMKTALLVFLNVVSIVAATLSGGYLFAIVFWLLSDGKYPSEVGQFSNGAVWVKPARSVFDDNNWITLVFVNHIALPLSVFIIAILLIRYFSMKLSSRR